MSDLAGSYPRTNRDLYEGTDHYYPGERAGTSSGGRWRTQQQGGQAAGASAQAAAAHLPEPAVAQQALAGWLAGLSLRCACAGVETGYAVASPAGLLTERWFPDSNPTNLRYEMRRQILELMAVSELAGCHAGKGWLGKQHRPCIIGS